MHTGFLLCMGLPGPTLDPPTRALLEDIQPGGIILFRRNVDAGLDALRHLIADLHALPWQPLVGIDHEGGRVVRLGEPFTHFPPAARIGHHNDARIAHDVARAMGRELASVGFDLVYAPVLDVLSHRDNTVTGDRAFSDNPATVARLGSAQIAGFSEAGLLCCGKHFPGHGDTAVDSHLGLPHVEAPWAVLEQRELVPFRAAVAAGVPMLMTAHVVYAASGSGLPATLDPLFLRTLLREQWHFDGVVVTDDLEMGAIGAVGPAADAAVRAICAGADGVLVCQTTAAAREVAAALAAAAREHPQFRQQALAARQRWHRVRQRLPRPRPRCPLPNAQHRALAASLA